MSQSTIGRAIVAVTPLLGKALREFVPVAEESEPDRQYLADQALGCTTSSDHGQKVAREDRTTTVCP